MKRKFLLPFLLIPLLFISCSNSQDSASISVSIPREAVAAILKSADSTDSPEYESLKIIYSLTGDIEQSDEKSIDDVSAKRTTVSFTDIPVGSYVQVSVTVYGISKGKIEYRLYTGTSEQISVKQGDNTVTLRLKEVKDIANISIEGIENIELSLTDEAGNALSEDDSGNIVLSYKADFPIYLHTTVTPSEINTESISIKYFLNRSLLEAKGYKIAITDDLDIQPGENTLTAEITYNGEVFSKEIKFLAE